MPGKRAAVLRAHRRERGALKLANQWAGADETLHPYWLTNLRVYQKVYSDALGLRLRLLRQYLSERAKRTN